MLQTLALALAFGAWGPAGCAPVGAPRLSPVISAPAIEWRQHATDPRWWGLFRAGVQVAAYDTEFDEYREYNAARDAWGDATAPPWGKPKIEQAPEQNFGIELDKLNRNSSADGYYTINGVPVARDQVAQMLGDPRIPDDSGKLRLTAIGDEAACKKVMDDLAVSPALAEFKGRIVPKSYRPAHWAVSRAGFVTSGQPTIYLQATDGKVLHRQDDYSGADDLAGAIRKADPSYKPEKDKDLRKPDLLPFAVPWWAGAAAVAALLAWAHKQGWLKWPNKVAVTRKRKPRVKRARNG